MTDAPDQVVDHVPQVCSGCGAGLAGAEVTGVARRQVVDIPEPSPQTTEHRAQTRRCAHLCSTAESGH